MSEEDRDDIEALKRYVGRLERHHAEVVGLLEGRIDGLMARVEELERKLDVMTYPGEPLPERPMLRVVPVFEGEASA